MSDIDPLSLEIPAPFTNLFQVAASRTIVRISFAERHGDGLAPRYRSAVVMSAEDAIGLAEAILRVAPKVMSP